MQLTHGFFALLLATAIAAPGVTFAQSNDGKDRRVDVVNHTNQPVYEFYASTSNKDSWEEDILGSDIIMPGARQRVDLDDGARRCVYDVKVVFKGDITRVKRQINICTTSKLHLFAEGIKPEE